MVIQFEQVIQLLLWCVLLFLIYKFKDIKIRIFFIFLCIVIFLFNPIKFKQEGISKIERRTTEAFTELPERVSLKELSFDEKQKKQMGELKKQSMESVKNEIN